MLRQWEHAKPLTAEQLVKLDQEKQNRAAKVEEKVFEIERPDCGHGIAFARESRSQEEVDLTRVKGRFFEARSQDLELRALADVLGLVGEMEMQIFGLDENDKKLVFNQESVRDLIVKIRSFEDQKTIGGLFNNATQGVLGGCTLSEFDSNATDFVEKIKEFRAGPEQDCVQHREF